MMTSESMYIIENHCRGSSLPCCHRCCLWVYLKLQIADCDSTVQTKRAQAVEHKTGWQTRTKQKKRRFEAMSDLNDILGVKIPFGPVMDEKDKNTKKSDTPAQAQLRAEHAAKSDKERHLAYRADQMVATLKLALQHRLKNKKHYLWKVLEEVAISAGRVLTIEPTRAPAARVVAPPSPPYSP
jgi:hypothetical protein